MTLTRSVLKVNSLLASLRASTCRHALVRGCLIIVISVLFGASLCRAQGPYTAASCNRSDVNTVINGPMHVAVDGDKIIIPAGTCTWSSGITVNVGIDITGSGTPNTGGGTVGAGTSTTTISVDMLSAVFFFNLSFGETAEVELLNLPANGSLSGTFNGGVVAFSGTCTSSGCPNVRADNLTFSSSWDPITLDGGFILVDNVFGVADHNYAQAITPTGGAPPLTQISFSSWQGVGSFGDNSFASADTFGTAQTFYIENNYLDVVRGSENDVSVGPSDTVGGARYVCRFNTLIHMSGTGLCSAHGTAWMGAIRGQRQVEVYYNTVSSGACNAINGLNSGTGYYFSNAFTGSGCNAVVDLEIARFVMNTVPWNSCDGTRPWDQIPWSSTSQCLDQPGRGAGLLLAGTNTAPVLASAPGTACALLGQCWTNPALDPVYEAGDTTPNNAPGVVVLFDISGGGSQARILANRDFYGQVSDIAQTSATSPFNGTTGTGYGTLARRPTTCTTGVGYWATDQGTWNTYNSQEGELFVCTATNTWTMHYEPYTYPHPLTGGGTVESGDPPSPPLNLTATVE